VKLNANPAMDRELEALAALCGTTIPEAVRRAIGLLKMVKEAEPTGQCPALIDKDGNVVARLTGI
jgi:hypothetical protein